MTKPPSEQAGSDDLVVPSLELIADSVATISGFGISVIREVRSDGRLYALALAGSEARLVAEQLSEGTSVADIQRVIDLSDDWGLFRFLPDERVGSDLVDRLVETGGHQGDESDAWRPHDILLAPLTTADGTLIGTLDLDLPVDGRRPDPEKRRALNRYAAQACRAVTTHFERDRLAREVEQAEAARQVVRRTASVGSEEAALRGCAPAVLACFGASLVAFWRADAPATDLVILPDGTEQTGCLSYPHDFATTLQMFADRRGVGVAGPEQIRDAESDPNVGSVLEQLAPEQDSTALCAPISALGTLYGGLVILRPKGAPAWTASEIDTILTICGDLGRALQNVRDFQREQAVVRELRRLDHVRSDLLHTVSHELKNPLTAILGTIELLGEETDDLVVERAIGTIERSAERLTRTIADLTAYGSARRAGSSGPVDLTAVVRDACDLLAVDADRRSTELLVELPPMAMRVRGDRTQLEGVVTNLVSNALKYTPSGGRVTVSLRRGEDAMVELSVADTGIGISPQDQERLFRTFFRSPDPRAMAEPGTGLGLPIVERIVAASGGSISVESALDSGSVFRVRLPEVPS